jgi:hypothetical protein
LNHVSSSGSSSHTYDPWEDGGRCPGGQATGERGSHRWTAAGVRVSAYGVEMAAGVKVVSGTGSNPSRQRAEEDGDVRRMGT